VHGYPRSPGSGTGLGDHFQRPKRTRAPFILGPEAHAVYAGTPRVSHHTTTSHQYCLRLGLESGQGLGLGFGLCRCAWESCICLHKRPELCVNDINFGSRMPEKRTLLLQCSPTTPHFLTLNISSPLPGPHLGKFCHVTDVTAKIAFPPSPSFFSDWQSWSLPHKV